MAADHDVMCECKELIRMRKRGVPSRNPYARFVHATRGRDPSLRQGDSDLGLPRVRGNAVAPDIWKMTAARDPSLCPLRLGVPLPRRVGGSRCVLPRPAQYKCQREAESCMLSGSPLHTLAPHVGPEHLSTPGA